MINFISCEQGVSNEQTRERVKQIVEQSNVAQNEPDYPEALQEILNKEVGGKWQVLSVPAAGNEAEGQYTEDQQVYQEDGYDQESPQYGNNPQVGVQDQQNDDYEEPMKVVFRVFDDEKQFRQSSDQLKISFDQLEINPIKLQSFTLLFQMSISPLPKEIKDDLNILSTGSSLMSKNLILGINKDQLLFFNFITQQGKLETMYSQMKLKRNFLYQIGLVFNNTDLYKELTLYINGSVENQVSLTELIDIPRGYFWIGSEQALKLFKGMIRDIVFVAQPLQAKQMKSIYADLQQNLSQNVIKTTADVVEEQMAANLYEPLQDDGIDPRLEQTQQSQLYQRQSSQFQMKHKSKKNLIPIHLQKSHFSSILQEEGRNSKNKKYSDEPLQTQENEPQQKSIKQLADILAQYLSENNVLFNKCRELSLHFYWVFTTCTLFSPPFDDGEHPKLPFDFLQQGIVKDRFAMYPVYAIETDRLIKIIHYADIQLTKEEMMDLSTITESLGKNKDYGYYILYDRLLLVAREATLQKEEIDNIKAMYSSDEKEQDQDLILISNGIHRQPQEPQPNFSFFTQLVKLVGGEQEAFKYRLNQLVAYYVQVETNNSKFPNVQKLTAVYLHRENEQEVEVEGVEFFQMQDDKIFSQRLEISEDITLKYFRVHYSQPMNQISMVSFKTLQQEETFLVDQSFDYQEGRDATGQLQTYPIEDGGRLSGFRGTISVDSKGFRQLISLQAEYLIKDPEVVKLKSMQPEHLPYVADNWNQGKFQLIVNRHQDSTAHTTTHWPSEIVFQFKKQYNKQQQEFATKFNELGNMLKEIFPNIELICNWDQRYQIEHFDVYIRGVGPQERRDRQGRIFLFKKFEKVKSFLEFFNRRMLKVYDELVLIGQAYGDTIELEKVQEHFFSTQSSLYPPRSKLAEDHPCHIPEKEEPTEEQQEAKSKKKKRN